MKRTQIFSCAILALSVSLPGAWAQGTAPAGGGTAAPTTTPATTPSVTRKTDATKVEKLSRGDRKFIESAAASGLFEVQAAQMAASRATDPQVKSFATMLVDHHTKANTELTSLAQAKQVTLPTKTPRAMRSTLGKLEKQKGAEFDREFVREVGLKDHKKDIDLFEKASKDSKDAEVKAFAVKTLPTLREHHAAAEKLPQASNKAGDAAAARSGAGSSTMGNTGSGAGTGKTGN